MMLKVCYQMKLLMADYKNSNKIKFRPDLCCCNVFGVIFSCFYNYAIEYSEVYIGKVSFKIKVVTFTRILICRVSNQFSY